MLGVPVIVLLLLSLDLSLRQADNRVPGLLRTRREGRGQPVGRALLASSYIIDSPARRSWTGAAAIFCRHHFSLKNPPGRSVLRAVAPATDALPRNSWPVFQIDIQFQFTYTSSTEKEEYIINDCTLT
jgi:hypothetical protein